MKTKREEEEEKTEGEEGNYKRQKLVPQTSPSPSPPRLAFDNALLPLASYDDDDDEEDDEKNNLNRGNVENNGGRMEQNGLNIDDDDDDDDDDDERLNQGRHNRMVEVRRDCPYLDTVNRQVFTASLCVCLVLQWNCSVFLFHFKLNFR